MIGHSSGAHQVMRTGQNYQYIVWKSYDEDGGVYVALFNAHNLPMDMSVSLRALELEGCWKVRDLWEHKDLGVESESIHGIVPVHGVLLVKLTKA